jgi:hypothetical protein
MEAFRQFRKKYSSPEAAWDEMQKKVEEFICRPEEESFRFVRNSPQIRLLDGSATIFL